jgi:ribose transport system substrate-binding protein
MPFPRRPSLALVALAATALLAAACGSSSSAGSSTSASSSSSSKAVFLGTYPGIDPYQAQLKVGFAQAGKALGVKTLWLTSTTFDVAQQSNITESALSTPGLKAVSVVAADPNSMEGALRLAAKKGLAVTQMAGCSPSSVSSVCFDTNPYPMGEQAAQEMAKLLHGKGDVVIATGTVENVNDTQRQEGFSNYVKAHYPNMHVVQVIDNCDEADNTVNCAQEAVSAHPNMSGYYGVGDQATEGALSVFPKAHIHPVVAAVDDDSYTIAGIKSGVITFSLVQPPYCQGYLMVLVPYLEIYKHLYPTVKYVDTGSFLVNKSNVNTYKGQIPAMCQKMVTYFKNVVMKPKK